MCVMSLIFAKERKNMKKALIIGALILAISTSITAGTLAVYITQIDTIATESNQVVAKQFILTGEGVGNFNTAVKIAPTETVVKSFTVSNNKGSVITETDMNVKVVASLSPADTKGIAGLVVTIKKGNAVLGTGTTDYSGNTEINFTDKFTANNAQTYQYDVSIEWPSGANDIEYVNAANKLSLTVIGTQS